MKKVNNWENVPEVESSNSLPVGAYVCKILNVIDNEQKEYLKIEFDIYEGQYKGWFLKKQQANQGSSWKGNYYRTYDDRSAQYFKSFITSIEQSNNNYKWEWNEQSLIGKLFVVVFGYEEYLDNGQIKKALKPRFVHSIKALKENRIKLPDIKRVSLEIPQPTYAPEPTVYHEQKKEETPTIDIPDSELPF